MALCSSSQWDAVNKLASMSAFPMPLPKGSLLPNLQSRGRAQSTRKLGTAGPAPNLAGPKDQGRVTLCVFMFLLLAFNPLALFLTSSSSATQKEAAVFSQHRTLTTAADDRYVAQFEQGQPTLNACDECESSDFQLPHPAQQQPIPKPVGCPPGCGTLSFGF